MSLEITSANKSFGGWIKHYTHHSEALSCDMRFAIYLPPQTANGRKVPVIYWLSGLTCTDENFMHKAGAQRIAAELGIAIVAPDTSPRCEAVTGDDDYDLGKGATAYLGEDSSAWVEYDASLLMRKAKQFVPALEDQGDADQFLDEQLQPDALEMAAQSSGYPLKLNR